MPMRIHISLSTQQLFLFDAADVLQRVYWVSTAKNGAGERQGSFQTPRGKHIVRAKIGDGAPIYSVFKGRRATGEIWSSTMSAEQPERDFILSRILWLSGCELGFNRLGNCDSMRRYIYIHGTPDGEPMGTPASHGCIRMRNNEVIELFALVAPYTPITLAE